MGKYSVNRMTLAGLIMCAVGFVFSLPFTNCSQNPQSARTPSSAFVAPTTKFDILKAEFQGKATLSFCQSHEAYSCMKRIYSAEVHDGKTLPTQECASLSNDMRICPVVQTYYFNSTVAQEECKGCQENYEYMEYSCHLKISNKQGLYPIIYTEPTMQESLLKLYELCIALSSEEAP